MEVKINREIRNYTEAMFFGLSLRQFIFSVCACVVAVGESRETEAGLTGLSLAFCNPKNSWLDTKGEVIEFEEILYWAQMGNKQPVEQIVEMYQPLLIKNALVDGAFFVYYCFYSL